MTMDDGDDDDWSGGNTSGDKLLRTRLILEVEGSADDSTETDDLAPTRVVVSLDEGRVKAGIELEETVSATCSCVESDEGPLLEGRQEG